MTGKQLSLTMASNSVVRRPAQRGRSAILEFLARLLTPADPVRSRLRAAQVSLDTAMRFSSPPRPSRPPVDRGNV
jgi:hypothetical protein